MPKPKFSPPRAGFGSVPSVPSVPSVTSRILPTEVFAFFGKGKGSGANEFSPPGERGIKVSHRPKPHFIEVFAFLEPSQEKNWDGLKSEFGAVSAEPGMMGRFKSSTSKSRRKFSKIS